jgi:hypothetical protein
VGIPFQTTSRVDIKPASGAIGDRITITGSGFARNSSISFDLDNASGIANVISDVNGSFTNTFTVPAVTGGRHNIVATDAGSNSATATISVSPSLMLSLQSGSRGTNVKIAGADYTAGSLINVKYNGIEVTTNPPAINTDARGSFSALFELPGGLPGSYSVEASDSDYAASTNFTSILTATMNQITSEVAPGHVGMPLTINGAGFKPNAKITVTRASTQEQFASVGTDSQGTLSTTFDVSPSAGGKHTIIVTDGTNTKEFEFYIERDPPPVPLLLAPDIDKKIKRPIFYDWKDVTDISGVTYILQISPNTQFDPVLFEEDNLTKSEYTMLKNEKLKSVTKENPYYWRVKAVDGASNESKWSETRAFSVGFVFTLPNGEPDLTAPAWVVYTALGAVILLAITSFVIGRKSFSL